MATDKEWRDAVAENERLEQSEQKVMSDKHFTFDGKEDPHFDTELELRIWMAGKNSEVAAKREVVIARLQDANKQLLAFVDSVVSINPFSETIEPRNWLIDVCKQAAALLASLSTDTP